jgi:hypothetical protein
VSQSAALALDQSCAYFYAASFDDRGISLFDVLWLTGLPVRLIPPVAVAYPAPSILESRTTLAVLTMQPGEGQR